MSKFYLEEKTLNSTYEAEIGRERPPFSFSYSLRTEEEDSFGTSVTYVGKDGCRVTGLESVYH